MHVREESCLGKGWGCVTPDVLMENVLFVFLAYVIFRHSQKSLDLIICMMVKFKCSRILGTVSEVIVLCIILKELAMEKRTS